MQVAVESRRSLRENVGVVALLLLLTIALAGCGRPALEKKTEKKPDAQATQEADARMQRNLQNALTALQPDQLGISSDTERGIAMLEEWSAAAKRQAEKTGERWEPRQTHRLLKSLPKEWVERATLDKFIRRPSV